MHRTSARERKHCTCVGAGVSLLCLPLQVRPDFLPFVPRRPPRYSTYWNIKSLASLQAPHDSVFYGKLMRDALVACGMADPGLLSAYPRSDPATLGLQGSHRRRLHSKSAVVAGETSYYVLLLFTGFPIFVFFFCLISSLSLPVLSRSSGAFRLSIVPTILPHIHVALVFVHPPFV